MPVLVLTLAALLSPGLHSEALSRQQPGAAAQQPLPTGPPGTAIGQPQADTADPAMQAFVETIAMQAALDRAGFSPGVIDGAPGANTRRALQAYERTHGRRPDPLLQPLATYTIAEQDVSGPFVESVPADLMKQTELPALAYTSAVEALAERFHTTPQVLQRLNPDAAFAAGEQILVPNVPPFAVPARRDVTGTSGQSGPQKDTGSDGAPAQIPALPRPDVVVTVSKSASALDVRDAGGRVIFFAPVTTGSEHDPLPIGEWKVTGVHLSPAFNYNPDLFWDADPSHAKGKIAPGPNNPVGVVWIGLSKDHYGLHGTPEPASIGKSASHGCVRLTNWDATELASLVKPGTRVVFRE